MTARRLCPTLRPSGKPRNRKYFREFGLYIYDEPGTGRQGNTCKTPVHIKAAAFLCQEQQRRRGPSVLRERDYTVRGSFSEEQSL